MSDTVVDLIRHHVVRAPISALYRFSVTTASLARVRSTGERPPTLVFHGRRGL